MPFYDAYSERKTKEVMQETWGHLAPEPTRKYSGWVLFTLTTYGNYEVIDCNFDRMKDSPWFFEDVNDFIGNKAKEYGAVYKFTGTYEKLKNEKYRFSGKTTRVKIP